MSRNRILHNVQDVFVGSTPDETDNFITGIAGHQILKRLTRVQSLAYSIDLPQEDVSTLGQSKPFSRNGQPPSVEVSLSYYLNGVDNERRIGLNVGSIEDQVYQWKVGLADQDGWTESNSTISVDTDGESIKVLATANNVYHKAYRDVTGITAGKKYRVTAKIKIPSGGDNIRGFQFRYANGTSTPVIHPTLDTWYVFSYADTAVDNGAYDGWIEFWMANSSSVDTTTTFQWVGNASNDMMFINELNVVEIKSLTHDACSSSTKDKRNIYLAVNEKDLDSHKASTFESSTALTESSLGDSSATGYSVVAFQNCYLTQYSLKIEEQSLPTVNLSYVSDNMVGYASGSGIEIPTLQAKSGIVTGDGTEFIIPNQYKEGTHYTGDFTASYSHAVATISRVGISGVDEFLNDDLLSCQIDSSIERQAIGYVGNKINSERKAKLPVSSKLTFETRVNKNISGSFLDNMKENENYNIKVDLKDKLSANLASFTFSGAKLESVSYDSAVMSNKSASLTFSAFSDLERAEEGLYAQGKITSAITGSTVIYPQF